ARWPCGAGAATSRPRHGTTPPGTAAVPVRPQVPPQRPSAPCDRLAQGGIPAGRGGFAPRPSGSGENGARRTPLGCRRALRKRPVVGDEVGKLREQRVAAGGVEQDFDRVLAGERKIG